MKKEEPTSNWKGRDFKSHECIRAWVKGKVAKLLMGKQLHILLQGDGVDGLAQVCRWIGWRSGNLGDTGGAACEPSDQWDVVPCYWICHSLSSDIINECVQNKGRTSAHLFLTLLAHACLNSGFVDYLKTHIVSCTLQARIQRVTNNMLRVSECRSI